MELKFGILGSGSWSTALAKILTDNGHTIQWWIRNPDTIIAIKKRKHNPHYLTTANFDVQQLEMSSSIIEVIRDSDVLVVGIPSAYLMPALFELPTDIFKGKKIISAIKGILPNEEHQLLNEYLEQSFHVPISDYFTVMGPCHAEEVAAEKLSYLTFSGVDAEATTLIASNFKTDYLNTVTNHDIWGTQYAAVLKNIYAVGAGMAHGLEYGDNFLSVYIANAADEMVGFLRKINEVKLLSCDGDAKLNYAASVYLGDLLVTCYSLYSRNRTFGNMIGKGYSVKVAQLEMNMVAEGYPASKGLYQINESVGASMPIAGTVYKILWEGLSAGEGFKEIEKGLK
ncbi:MAG: NAD(P)H-dependent glycerol-3-phosphate dehydrogenase [Chitinophagaceae bacterium]